MATELEVAGGTGAERDRRAHLRCPVDEKASVQLLSPHRLLLCHLIELSLGGCRIRAVELNRVAPGMRIEIQFKVNGFAFRFSGVVKWAATRNEPGLNRNGRHASPVIAGIGFSGTLPRQLEDLRGVLAELELRARNKAAEAGQLAAPHPIYTPVQPWPIQPPVLAIAPVPVLTTSFELHPVISARERRVQARESVDSFASVLVVKSGSRLKGRIVDLSRTGCGIRLDERHQRGIYTRVEVEFRLEGLPFRLGGVTQSIRDKHTIGIRFLDMSERKLSQVVELIAELRDLAEAEPGLTGSELAGAESDQK